MDHTPPDDADCAGPRTHVRGHSDDGAAGGPSAFSDPENARKILDGMSDSFVAMDAGIPTLRTDNEGFTVVPLVEAALPDESGTDEKPQEAASTSDAASDGGGGLVLVSAGNPAARTDDEGFVADLPRGDSSEASDVIEESQAWADLRTVYDGVYWRPLPGNGSEAAGLVDGHVYADLGEAFGSMFAGQYVDVASPDSVVILERIRTILELQIEQREARAADGNIQAHPEAMAQSQHEAQSIVVNGSHNKVNGRQHGQKATQKGSGKYAYLVVSAALMAADPGRDAMSDEERAEFAQLKSAIEREAGSKTPNHKNLKKWGGRLLALAKTGFSAATAAAVEAGVKMLFGQA